ncbi:hypothetical protein pipiens_011674 [Culex pipiens pipiens]|uniref:Uncharacterized protein n=1 Tax=Culex pipiens pipiens TaxID=38569 RepID=A0ABD1CV78_CULPP|nr:uncharacterized protein LOC120422802 [Culex pipiens pallens]
MDFEPRTIVNGAQLKHHPGKAVSIHLFVDRAETDGRSFTGRSTDGLNIQVVLSQPLSELLHGWVEVIGMAGSNESVRCKEIITYKETEESAFDAFGHDALCTFLANCKDIFQMT